MSVDQRLREILTEDAKTFRPDVERSLHVVLLGARRRRRRLGWLVTAAVLAILVAGAAVWPWGGAGTVADPAKPAQIGQWRAIPTGPLSARHDPVGAWVGQRFVIIGGRDTRICPPNAKCTEGHALQDGAAFDPVSQTWQPIATAPAPIGDASTAVIGDQLYLLVPATRRTQEPSRFLRYDSGADRWTELPAAAARYTDRQTGRAPANPDRRLVAAGRFVVALNSNHVQGETPDLVYDPARESWYQLPADPLGPSWNRTAVWTGTALLLVANTPHPGSVGNNPASPDVIRLAELDGRDQQQSWPFLNFEAWTSLPDGDTRGHEPAAVGSRILWPRPGSDPGTRWNPSYPFGGIYDPARNKWLLLPKPPAGRGLNLAPDAACCLLAVGERLVIGGHLLDPSTNSWLESPSFPDSQREAATVVSGPTTILVWGGGTLETNLNTGYLLRL